MKTILRAFPWVAVVLLAGCSTLLTDSYHYGTIEVRARLESGEPADGIPVILYRSAEHLAYGVTDFNGEYTFDFVPFGSVGVYVQLYPAYLTADSVEWDYRDGIDVSDGGATTAVFGDLIRLEPPPAATPLESTTPQR